MNRQRVLLTGATGYIGGQLLRPLEQSGCALRCAARRANYLRPRVADGTEVVEADVLEPSSLGPALEGVDVAYYLIHSMGDRGAFHQKEREAALNFARAAEDADVQRIIYLGGLGHGDDLSPHLASRHEVGEILRASKCATIEFRSSIIIGSGSLSFEMIRALTDRLPVMITPRWVRMKTQAIAVEDVIAYLLAAKDIELEGSHCFEIGGTSVVSYGELMREYARQRRLRRLLIPVPFLTPRLSSLWLGLVTPLYSRVGRKLIDSIRHETVVRDDSARRIFDIEPGDITAAIEQARVQEDREFAETRWSDAISANGPPQGWGGLRFGSRLVDSRALQVPVPPSRAFRPIRRIGGKTGWYYANWLWTVRGLVDLLAGGVGLRRGRRDPERLATGDTIDWWRVREIEADDRLRLLAEMKVPGRAWLQFEVTETETGSQIRQTVVFDPRGLFGLVYWYGIWPLHALIFRGMLRGIARAAVEAS
ncbi:MAG: SDR family oxidoreductase [Planctomycetota bacterium]|jgi:uncharacterized protein YbjT (DUF2867 family)